MIRRVDHDVDEGSQDDRDNDWDNDCEGGEYEWVDDNDWPDGPFLNICLGRPPDYIGSEDSSGPDTEGGTMLHPKANELLKILRDLDEDDALDLYGFELDANATDATSQALVRYLDSPEPPDADAVVVLEALAEAWKRDPRAYSLVDEEAPLEVAVAEWLALGAPVWA